MIFCVKLVQWPGLEHHFWQFGLDYPVLPTILWKTPRSLANSFSAYPSRDRIYCSWLRILADWGAFLAQAVKPATWILAPRWMYRLSKNKVLKKARILSDRLYVSRALKTCIGQPEWLSGLAPPLAQGVILETRDPVPRRALCMEPASPSASLSVSMNK